MPGAGGYHAVGRVRASSSTMAATRLSREKPATTVSPPVGDTVSFKVARTVPTE